MCKITREVSQEWGLRSQVKPLSTPLPAGLSASFTDQKPLEEESDFRFNVFDSPRGPK